MLWTKQQKFDLETMIVAESCFGAIFSDKTVALAS